MRIVLLFFLFFMAGLVFFRCPGTAQGIQFTLAPPPVNYPAFTVNGMAQDMQGFLWLATAGGLYKYDGNQYTPYRNQPFNSTSPGAVSIESVIADKKGNIWTAPIYAGLEKFNPVTGDFLQYRHHDNDPNSLGNDTIWCILEDHTGAIWLGTNYGIDKLDSKTNKFVHYRHNPGDTASLSYNVLRTIYEDKQGTIWAGTGNTFAEGRYDTRGGLNKFDRATGKFTRYLHDEKNAHSLADNRVCAMLEDSRGVFWIGTAGDGLHTLNRSTGIIERHSYDPSHPEKLSRPAVSSDMAYSVDHITFLKEDATGKIWIGSFKAGINVYDPATGKLSHYGYGSNSNEKPQDNFIWSAYQTRDNILWISSWENHLYKIMAAQTNLPHIKVGWPVVCFAEDDAHTLWMTSLKGLIHKNSNGTEEIFLISKDSSAPANQMFSLEKDGNAFWLSTGGGLYNFNIETKEFSRYPKQAGDENRLLSDTINIIKKDAGNGLWLSTRRGLDMLDTKTGIVQHFQHNEKDTGSISNSVAITVNTDREQNIWVGTEKGANRLNRQTGKFKTYLPLIGVILIFEDSQGVLWASTEVGLFRYNKAADNFYPFIDDASVLTPTLLFWITEDNDQNLWLCSQSQGILKLNKARTSVTLYGKNQGVDAPALLGYSIIRHNGEMVFADTTGYYSFQPRLLQQNMTTPMVTISRFSINDKLVLPVPEKTLELHYNQNTFSFEIDNIDFSSAHEDSRLLFKLENYDNAWRKAGEEKTAYYFNLAAGKYVFKVKALNAAGLTAEKNIEIIISPPWYKTWWAYVLFIAAVTGLGYFIYRNHINGLRKKQSAQISIMVAAQEGERKRIARDLHDDVGTKLSALKLFLSSLKEKSTHTGHPEMSSLASSAEQFISEVMKDVRQLLSNLSPAVLEEFGCMTAVEGLINKINQAGQVHFELVTFGMPNRLQHDYELALYRITQELISNVLKHAEAKNASLQIGWRNEKIVLMIEDDGKGFDTTLHTDGYGLHNLASRTKLMNGSIVIDAQPGRGSSVVIEIPYQIK